MFTGKRILILVFSAVLLLLFFLYYPARQDERGFSFIENYFDASRPGFDENYNLKAAISPLSLDRTYILRDYVHALISKNFEKKIKNKSGLHLIAKDNSNRTIYLKVRNIRKNRQTALLVNSETITRKFVFQTGARNNLEIRNKHDEIISKIGLQKSINDYIVLQITRLDDYVFITSEDKLIYQERNAGLKNNPEISLDVKQRSPDYILKTTEINGKQKEEIYNKLSSTEGWPLPEHLINSNSPSFNKYDGEDEIRINGQISKYLKRVRSKEYTFRTVLIPLFAGKLRYDKIKIPSHGRLKFRLGTISYTFQNPANYALFIEIEDNRGSKKIYDFPVPDKPEEYLPLKLVNLKEFADKEVTISFSLLRKKNHPGPDNQNATIMLIEPEIVAAREPEEKNVVIILLDTLRADHLGCYGYGQETSQHIDKFSSENAIFLNCASNSSWTLPSHMSLFTSRFPYETGFNRSRGHSATTRLASNIKTLAEILRKHNYQTAAYTGGAYVSSIFDFDRGFDIYYESREPFKHVTGLALEWLSRMQEEKFFLFLHTYETHEPYNHDFFLKRKDQSSLSRNEIATLRYDSCIREADIQVNHVFEWLRKNSLMQDTLVLITSDHGEAFDKLKSDSRGQPAGTHGYTLYDEITHVPLIIGGCEPFNNSVEYKRQVSLIDVMPTILQTCGIESPSGIRGVPLPAESADRRIAYSEATRGGHDKRSVRSPENKIIETLNLSRKSAKPVYEFYALNDDPEENKNLAGLETKTFNRFKKMLFAVKSSIMENRKAILMKMGLMKNTSEVDRTIEDLGYLGK